MNLINNLKKIEQKVSLQELIKNLISKINYFKYLEEDPQTSDDRKENVEELLAKASLYDLENEDSSLEKFLEEISLISTMDKKDETDVLKLMSLHNSKGLEFDLVFIAGLEEDILPHANSKNSLEELEEERRLFYVGMTRAKKHLIISSSQNRFMWGFSKPMLPSRFIKEIPTKYIKMQKNDQNTFRSKSFTPRQTNNIEDLENSNIFKNGTTVVHNTFGKGLVKKAYNTSMGQTYDVLFFDGNIIRSLAQKYAKLQKC